MGLMYIFPVGTDEVDRTEIISNTKTNSSTIILKSYGLPMIFWGYLAAGLIVLGSMWLASRATLTKLLNYEDPGLHALGLLVQYTLVLTPIVLLAFFFYEKQIHKSDKDLKLVFKLFFIPVFFKKMQLKSYDSFSVDHYMDSPNMAKIYNKAELKAFENKGYFELHALNSDGISLLIDRHSRKADLLKIKDLLSKY